MIMKAGLIVAVEIDALKTKYGEPVQIHHRHGREIMEYKTGDHELFVIDSGAGELKAAANTQLLISEFDVDVIFNFGVVGGLTGDMAVQRLCIVDQVIHYEYDTSPIDHTPIGSYPEFPSGYIPADRNLLEKATQILPDAKPVICASGEKFIADPAKKAELHDKFNADICEMESAGILMTCSLSGIPCLMLKMVSDSVEGGAEEFGKEVANTSARCMDALDTLLASF